MPSKIAIVKFSVIPFIVLLFILQGCSASKKAFKQAQEYEAAGLYVEAAEQDLKALREDSNYKDALVHLKQVAPKAYDELLRRASNLEKANNWEQAVTEYEHLDELLQRFYAHGVVFQTVDINRRLEAAEQQAAQKLYTEAESQFNDKKWNEAAYSYLRTHRYVDNYNGSFDKAIQSFLNAGNARLSQQKFSSAIDTFEEILKIAPGHRVATQKIAEGHYLHGRQHFEAGWYRDALSAFERAHGLVPDFRDVEKWLDRAYERAIQYIAVFPFLNQSSVTMDGYFIASEIATRIQHANLEFVDLLPYPEVVMLVNDAGFHRSNALVEAEILETAREEQLDSFVWGKVRYVSVRDEEPRFVEVEHQKPIVVEDSLGNKIEETESIYYREYTQRRNVELGLELMVVGTESGQILLRENFSDDLTDVAKWVAYQGSIYDLPEEKRPLLDAPRNPRPVEVVLDDLLVDVCERMSREVVRFYR